MGEEDWEEQMIRQMTEMFKQMGFPMAEDQLRSMIEQFRDQFEKMGIDPEALSGGGVNLNVDLSQFHDLIKGGGDVKDILDKMGMKVEVDAKPVEVDTPDDEEDEEEMVKELPAADIYLDGWTMSVTIDCSMQVELEEGNIELELVEEGQLLEVLKASQSKPVARVSLPHPCEELMDWSLNNGILDLTLKLTPQGSALGGEDGDGGDDGDDGDEGFDDSDAEPPEVSIDLADDDDEDGGIPIL